MTKQRADLGFGSALDDLGSFDPKAQPPSTPRPAKEDVVEAARAAGFRSREPKALEPPKAQRRRRTGRNVQFNIKATAETIAAFCDIADRNGWGLGETLERAVQMLKTENRKG